MLAFQPNQTEKQKRGAASRGAYIYLHLIFPMLPLLMLLLLLFCFFAFVFIALFHKLLLLQLLFLSIVAAAVVVVAFVAATEKHVSLLGARREGLRERDVDMDDAAPAHAHQHTSTHTHARCERVIERGRQRASKQKNFAVCLFFRYLLLLFASGVLLKLTNFALDKQ